MFLIITRNFPPEIGGIQMLMEGLCKNLLNHGPVKVFAYEHENSKTYDNNIDCTSNEGCTPSIVNPEVLQRKCQTQIAGYIMDDNGLVDCHVQEHCAQSKLTGCIKGSDDYYYKECLIAEGSGNLDSEGANHYFVGDQIVTTDEEEVSNASLTLSDESSNPFKSVTGLQPGVVYEADCGTHLSPSDPVSCNRYVHINGGGTCSLIQNTAGNIPVSYHSLNINQSDNLINISNDKGTCPRNMCYGIGTASLSDGTVDYTLCWNPNLVDASFTPVNNSPGTNTRIKGRIIEPCNYYNAGNVLIQTCQHPINHPNIEDKTVTMHHDPPITYSCTSFMESHSAWTCASKCQANMDSGTDKSIGGLNRASFCGNCCIESSDTGS